MPFLDFLNFQLPASAPLQKKNRLRRNEFGTFVSGPIVRNRTFWSFDYEGRRENDESVTTTYWPNQNFRNGNFSALLTPTTNPATGKPFRSAITVFDPLTSVPFPNNILPASRLSPGALNVMSKYIPLPDFQQPDILAYDVSRNVATPITADQYFGRLDHNLTSRDKLFGRVALQNANEVANQINPNFPQYQESDAYNVATGWVHTFSPTLLNEFRFGVNNWGDDLTNPRTNTSFDINSLGIGQYHVVGDGNRNLTALEQGVPTMSFSGSGFSLGDQQGRTDNSWSYQFYDNFCADPKTAGHGDGGFRRSLSEGPGCAAIALLVDDGLMREQVSGGLWHTPRREIGGCPDHTPLALTDFAGGHS